MDDEGVPITAQKMVVDRDSGGSSMETVTRTVDECTRPGTTAEGLASLRPVIDGGVLTAANASRRSDRAAACGVVDATEAERRGIDPLALYRGFTGLGCEPDEMGNGPVFAVPRPLDRLVLGIATSTCGRCHPLIAGPVAARNTCENVRRWRHGCARLFEVL